MPRDIRKEINQIKIRIWDEGQVIYKEDGNKKRVKKSLEEFFKNKL